MKIVLLTIGLVFGLVMGAVSGAVVMHFLYSPIFDEPPINFQTIYFPKTGTKIYTVARIWGITGNSEEVRLCSEPFEFGKRDQTEQCVVFDTDRIFYKKDGATSIKVYAPGWSVSPEIKKAIGGIQISVKELRSFDEVKAYEENFEEYGLSTIAAPDAV